MHDARWLEEELKLEISQESRSCAFQLACEKGHLPVLRCLVNGLRNTQGINICNLTTACVNGHIHVVNWLLEEFDFEKRDVMLEDNDDLLEWPS